MEASNILYDPTPERKWLSKKAKSMGLSLKSDKPKNLPVVPKDFEYDVIEVNACEGWSKSLENLPKLTLQNIDTYFESINNSILEKSKKPKKQFNRGNQLLEEQFLDINSIFSKENQEYFCIKYICAASLKKANRWLFLFLEKKTNHIAYAYCQCPAGKTGTCSHSFAMMKLVSKWVIDQLKFIPYAKACISGLCTWSVPQSRDRVHKPQINSISLTSPPSKEDKKEDSTESKTTIHSLLYDPRQESARLFDSDKVKNLVRDLKKKQSKYSHFVDFKY